MCNAMIRADLFAKFGRFDPAARGMFEDLSFFGKALAMAPAYVSDGPGPSTASTTRAAPLCPRPLEATNGRDWGARPTGSRALAICAA